MKTMFVVAGRPPGWVTEQTSLAAQQLTEDGRVLVTFTDGFDPEIQLPGSAGSSTLLGIAPSGYPLWTGRLSSALGLRRRQETSVLVLFDGVRMYLMLTAALVARLRRERVILHDLRSANETTPLRRLARAALGRLAHRSVRSAHDPNDSARSVALALCDGDLDFTRLVIRTATAMSAQTAAGWRFVVQSSHPDVEALIAQAGRADVLSCVNGPAAHDLIMASDVIVTPYGAAHDEALAAAKGGAAAVIVGHPFSDRITRRFDGTWLARSDISSMVVALESARGSLGGNHRSASEMRAEVRRVVSEVRLAALQNV